MKNRTILFTVFISLLVVIITVITVIVIYNHQLQNAGLKEVESFNNYEDHYAFISEEQDSPFWDSIYRGALECGLKNNIYVENFGENLSQKYTPLELMEIAIEADVDGIIIKGDSTKERQTIIDKAVEKGINVVTVIEESMESKQCSYVGINGYKLGEMYAEQIQKYAKDESDNVIVIIDSLTAGPSQKMVYSGITNTLKEKVPKMNVKAKNIDYTSSFGAEEEIRNLIIDSSVEKDMIVCLNLTNTLCAYQSIVDLNLVGQIKILGYYSSDIILEAIAQNVISAVTVIDTEKIGENAVNILNEYIKHGQANKYVIVDTEVINSENVEEYMDSYQAE